MANLPVIDLDASGSGSGVFQLWKYTATNYADLLTKTGMVEGDLAIVYNSQGVWLINRKLKGVYIYQSGVWEYANQELQDQIQSLDLEKVMNVNNITGSNDLIVSDNQQIILNNGAKIVPANGTGVQFDLRQGGVDGNVLLENDQTFLSMTSFGVTIQDEDFFQGVSVPSVTLSNGNQASLFLLKGDFTKTGGFAIRDNETLDIVSLNLPNYPATMCSQNSTLKQNVINAIALCGKDQIVKSDDYPVLNGIAYNTGLAGELIVVHTPSATDRTQTHQDDDGIIALTKNIPKAFFAINLDSAESSISRVFAGGRTTFTVTHNLNNLDLKPEVFRLSDGRTVGWRVERTGVNTVEVSRTGNVADGLFRILI